MNGARRQKVATLERRLLSLESAVVAFSGGVDSSVLAAVARRVLGERMIAATAVSASLPAADREAVARICAAHGIPHVIVETRELSDPQYAANPEDRCYYCKQHLLERMEDLADERGFAFVVEGTNAQDLGGHRPGNRASQERSRVVTPLIEAGFTKDDVRQLAHELKLEVAEKPAAACLASRVPTGTPITAELLGRIDAAEDLVRSCGIVQVRVRHHGELARVEVAADDVEACLAHRERIAEALAALGWRFVTLDLRGYRTGGMRG